MGDVCVFVGADVLRVEGVAFRGCVADGGEVVVDFNLSFWGDPGLLLAPTELASSSPAFEVLLRSLPTFKSLSRLIVPLAVRFLAIGVSRSYRSAGIGTGLDVMMGILDPDFLSVGLE